MLAAAEAIHRNDTKWAEKPCNGLDCEIYDILRRFDLLF